MNFKRGLDPKEAMGIGWRAIFDSMENCLLITQKEDLYNNPGLYNNIEAIDLYNIRKQKIFIYQAFVIIVVIDDKFKILKNRFMIYPIIDNKVYKIEKLPKVVFRIKEEYDKWINGNDENVD